MSIYPIHSNIKQHIIEELLQAKFFIYGSIAWFNDRDIFDILVEKAKEGLVIELIIRDDSEELDTINFNPENSLPFGDLENSGGKVYLLKNNHNKYAVIDLRTVISGSYNWTYGAHNKNEGLESIHIAKNEHETAAHDAAAFIKLRKIATPLFVKIQSINEAVEIDDEFSKGLIVGASRLDHNIVKLTFEGGAFAYCTMQQIGRGLLQQSHQEIRMSDQFKVIQRAGVYWFEETVYDRREIVTEGSINDSPGDDLPF